MSGGGGGHLAEGGALRANASFDRHGAEHTISPLLQELRQHSPAPPQISAPGLCNGAPQPICSSCYNHGFRIVERLFPPLSRLAKARAVHLTSDMLSPPTHTHDPRDQLEGLFRMSARPPRAPSEANVTKLAAAMAKEDGCANTVAFLEKACAPERPHARGSLNWRWRCAGLALVVRNRGIARSTETGCIAWGGCLPH